MPSQSEFFQLVLENLKNIETQIGQLRLSQTEHSGKIHKRIDEIVKERSECELRCKDRDREALERDKDLKDDLKDRIYMVSGLMSSLISIIFRGIEWLFTKVIK